MPRPDIPKALIAGAALLLLQAGLQVSGYVNTQLAWILGVLSILFFILAAVLWWRERKRIKRSDDTSALPVAINAQTEEMRPAREQQKYASDPHVKAFNDARTNDIRSGADIGELPLGVAVHQVIINSAWGRWQAAQHFVQIGDQHIFRIAESNFLDYLQKGRIASRGHRNGDANYNEFISPDWWGQFYFRLDEDSRQIYKASIHPRYGVDATKHPSYTGICCEWQMVRALFPERDEQTDATTAAILATRPAR